VLTQIAVYCGIPVGVDCFRLAKAVLSEAKKPWRWCPAGSRPPPGGSR